jgi:methionine synthase II (cobalamin-independent)
MAHVYRADTIGSLLRPQYLKLAREQCEAGQLETAAYKEIEDRAVDQAIAMQEGVGLDVVTDGELRRHTFIDQLTEQVEGLTLDPGDSGHVPVPIHDEAGQLKSVFTIPLSVTDKLQRSRMMTVEEYSYARGAGPAPGQGDAAEPADAVPGLVAAALTGRLPRPVRDVRRRPAAEKEEATELARLGCRYIQVDAPDFGQLVDPSQRESWERAGISVDRVFSEGADLLNELATVPGVSFGLHLCRGNYDSDWISTGTYDTISKQLFQRATNYDAFLLEYDDERSVLSPRLAMSPTTRWWYSAWSRRNSTGWSRPTSWPRGSTRRAASSRGSSSRCRRSAASPPPDLATRSARTPRRTSCAWWPRSRPASGDRFAQRLRTCNAGGADVGRERERPGRGGPAGRGLPGQRPVEQADRAVTAELEAAEDPVTRCSHEISLRSGVWC